MNGVMFAVVLLGTGAYSIAQDFKYKKYIPRYKIYVLKDENRFTPIRKELPKRYEDKDMCKIFHGKDLQDCVVNTEGTTPSPSPEPESK